MSLDNVEVIWDTVVEEIVGSDKVEALKLNNKKTGEKSELKVDGVFVAVGIEPDSGQYAGQVETDNQGYIIAGAEADYYSGCRRSKLHYKRTELSHQDLGGSFT